MPSIRNVEQTSLKSKVLHIGLGIILATSLLPIAPNQLFADEVTNNKATTFTDQVTESTKTSQTYQVTDINQIPDLHKPKINNQETNDQEIDDQPVATTQAEKPNQTSESQQTTKTELAKSISVAFTNDVHCQIDPVSGQSLGYPGVAAYIDKAQEAYGDDKVTLIDAGDAVQGGLAGTFTKGEAIIELMNEVGYDYAIPGNHEFDFGMDQFNWIIENSTATYLSSNFRNLQTDSLCLATYAIEEYQGIDDGDPEDGDDILKVAYVGITTPESLTKSTPTYFQDENGNFIYDFSNDSTGDALYDAVQIAVDNAQTEGAEYVIAIGHLGNTGITDYWTSNAVIANTDGIDVLIDGHYY